MKAPQVKEVNKLKGIGVSPGIVIGKARILDRSRVKIFYQYLLSDEQVNSEEKRFREALDTTREQIITLKNKIPDQVKKHAFILDTHLMVMNDGMFYDSTIDTIVNEKINAEWALKKSVQKIRQIFEQIEDEYIRERINDVEDIAERILRNLVGREKGENGHSLDKSAITKIEKLLKEDRLSLKDIASQVASDEGFSYRDIYKRCLSIKRGKISA